MSRLEFHKSRKEESSPWVITHVLATPKTKTQFYILHGMPWCRLFYCLSITLKKEGPMYHGSQNIEGRVRSWEWGRRGFLKAESTYPIVQGPQILSFFLFLSSSKFFLPPRIPFSKAVHFLSYNSSSDSLPPLAKPFQPPAPGLVQSTMAQNWISIHCHHWDLYRRQIGDPLNIFWTTTCDDVVHYII